MTVKLTIDGRAVDAEPGQTVLAAARANGIVIPTLCYHADLSPAGSCRLCVVEIEEWRGQQAACTTPVAEGMVVRTETPALVETRRSVLELLLRNYVDAGYASTAGGDTEFRHWVRRYGASLPAGFTPAPRFAVDSDPNPFVWVDFNKCILCTRCVRACAEVQGRFVWGTAERGADARIVAGADTDLLSARCESCGACVAYCPTGALDNKLSMALGAPDRLVTTVCPYCGVGCQFDLNVKDGRILRVTSHPGAPVNNLALCVKGRYGYDFVHHPDRLTRPRVRRYLLDGTERPHPHNPRNRARAGSTGAGDRGEWVEVDWDTALDLAAGKLAAVRRESGPDAVGLLTSAKCTNEENYLVQKLARQVIGTHNVDHCARL